jgi:hypothetical protein
MRRSSLLSGNPQLQDNRQAWTRAMRRIQPKDLPSHGGNGQRSEATPRVVAISVHVVLLTVRLSALVPVEPQNGGPSRRCPSIPACSSRQWPCWRAHRLKPRSARSGSHPRERRRHGSVTRCDSPSRRRPIALTMSSPIGSGSGLPRPMPWGSCITAHTSCTSKTLAWSCSGTMATPMPR